MSCLAIGFPLMKEAERYGTHVQLYLSVPINPLPGFASNDTSADCVAGAFGLGWWISGYCLQHALQWTHCECLGLACCVLCLLHHRRGLAGFILPSDC